METVGRVAHYAAWTFAVMQILVLLSTCLTGFSEVQLGLAVIGQVAFFGFLFISTLAEGSRIPVRGQARER
jgi:hypothetical protein